MPSLLDSWGAYHPVLNNPDVGAVYTTPTVAGIPGYENGKQFAIGVGSVTSFYGFNSSNAEVYVLLSDTADGLNPAVGDRALLVVTVPFDGFVSDKDAKYFTRGLFARAYTDPALTTPAGNVMSWAVKTTVFE
jgi:hypothetical protein